MNEAVENGIKELDRAESRVELGLPNEVTVSRWTLIIECAFTHLDAHANKHARCRRLILDEVGREVLFEEVCTQYGQIKTQSFGI